jgi:hypothetical protein
MGGMRAMDTQKPLYEFAHARAGDKGDCLNISVIAYHAEDYPQLVKWVTAERVSEHFAARQPASVTRYLLPNLHAMNFVLEDVLDGGVNDSLNLDMHGKTLSYHLLSMKVG